ncbi:MAG: hypothetical protein IPQ24_13105 [Anaeromyxobacter sp.]|nr:hypothetical protein [Anaeromyxobacter sp.]
MDLKMDLTPILIVSIVFLASTAIVGIVFWFLHRSRELRHETIRLALEKGQPLPLELLEGGERKTKETDLQKGIKLVLDGVGISLFFLLAFRQERLWPIGLIVGFVGIGHLVSHWVTGRKQADAPSVG